MRFSGAKRSDPVAPPRSRAKKVRPSGTPATPSISEFPQADVRSGEPEGNVAAVDARDDPVRIGVGPAARRQVGGDDDGLLLEQPCVEEAEELRRGEAVGHLGAEVVDDQQVACIDGVHFVQGHTALLVVETIVLEELEKLEGGQVNDRLAPVQKVLGDGVAQESLA